MLDASILRQLDLERAIAPCADAGALAAFARILRELRPDIVHAHSSKAGAIARLARLLHPRVPLVYTPHGYSFAGHFSRRAERQVYRAIERSLAPLASRVICVCEAEAVIARVIGPNDRVRVVHNGISASQQGRIDPRIAELSRAGPVVGALTLLRPGKGLETLIDAMPRVLEQCPDVQVAIVGEGTELDSLQARAARRGAEHAVHFLGKSADPSSMLRGMDMFVHPSWAEAFPYVVLEAMSQGLAILASDVGGISEAVADGESGLLVPPDDHEALGERLIELIEDPARRERMGAAALHRQHQRFTFAKMIDHTSEIYDEIAIRRKRR